MELSNIFVSIIIPVIELNDYLRESIYYISKLSHPYFEIILIPNNPINSGLNNNHRLSLKFIPAGKIGPADKRDIGAKFAKGEILAFIDDDAYPRKDWLTNALKHFKDPEVAAVGGPAVTPEHDSFWQKVSGAVFLSRFAGGHPDRYWPGKGVYEVDDLPSVNLLVRKDIFEKVGGFNCKYWPGEDTKLCLAIKKLNKKIIYDPDVFVWHHRRASFLKHLKQAGNYGLHRGFFAKRYPENSRKFRYFLPSLLVLFLVFGFLLANVFKPLFKPYLTGILVYITTIFLGIIDINRKIKNIKISLATLPYTIGTHIWYGIRFLQGFLFTKELKSKLGR